MAKVLAGAYVQAWVWVENSDTEANEEPTDGQFRTWAISEYAHEGELEIDPNAPVNRSYEAG